MTPDGQGTFHGMGVIAISTPNGEAPLTTKSQVVRREQCVKVNELVKDKRVQITSYFSTTKSLTSVIFKPVKELKFPYTLPSDYTLIYFGTLGGYLAGQNYQDWVDI